MLGNSIAKVVGIILLINRIALIAEEILTIIGRASVSVYGEVSKLFRDICHADACAIRHRTDDLDGISINVIDLICFTVGTGVNIVPCNHGIAANFDTRSSCIYRSTFSLGNVTCNGAARYAYRTVMVVNARAIVCLVVCDFTAVHVENSVLGGKIYTSAIIFCYSTAVHIKSIPDIYSTCLCTGKLAATYTVGKCQRIVSNIEYVTCHIVGGKKCVSVKAEVKRLLRTCFYLICYFNIICKVVVSAGCCRRHKFIVCRNSRKGFFIFYGVIAHTCVRCTADAVFVGEHRLDLDILAIVGTRCR